MLQLLGISGRKLRKRSLGCRLVFEQLFLRISLVDVDVDDVVYPIEASHRSKLAQSFVAVAGAVVVSHSSSLE